MARKQIRLSTNFRLFNYFEHRLWEKVRNLRSLINVLKETNFNQEEIYNQLFPINPVLIEINDVTLKYARICDYQL